MQPYQQFNPYQQPMQPWPGFQAPQPQVPQQVPQQNVQQKPFGASFMPGRYVSSESEITPQDVPMDGSMALFPAKDGSCIYARSLDSNFNMRSVRYVPEPQEEQQDVSSVLAALERRVAALEGSRPAHYKEASDE